MKFTAPACVALAMLLSAAQVAHTGAATAANSGTQAEQEACTPDVFKLCSGSIPNENRIVACLKRNEAKLSSACRAVISGSASEASNQQRQKR